MIVVAGEALMDLIVAPDGSVSANPGGGPYNTARTIARLGQPVAFLGRISSDRFGTELRANLARDGVSSDGVIETDDPTTLALVELDEHGVATYQFYVDGTSAAGLTDAEADAVMAAPAAAGNALHVGTLGLVLEPVGTTLERMVSGADTDRLVMVDPNYRPSATPDLAAFRARIDRIAGRADVVKVSDEDLRFLAPEEEPEAIDRAPAPERREGGPAHPRRGRCRDPDPDRSGVGGGPARGSRRHGGRGRRVRRRFSCVLGRRRPRP